MYYLQSRYYDPYQGRFISADKYPSTGQGLLGNNMYAYCNNNPPVQSDKSGEFGLILSMGFGLAFGVASQFIGGVISNALNGKTGAALIENTGSVGDYVAAAITGAVCAIPGASTAVSIICDVAAPAIQQGVDCLLSENTTWNWGEYGSDVAGNLVCDWACNQISVDSPSFIRDIKKEATKLGKKGTRALTAFLKQAQNKAFLVNQSLGVMVSGAAEVYKTAWSKAFGG